MSTKTIEEMTAEGAFKEGSDAEAAARIAAHGFASEMERLASLFRLDKIADMGEGEGAEFQEEAPAGGDDEEMGAELLALLQDLGGL